jgi:hypothetical protein
VFGVALENGGHLGGAVLEELVPGADDEGDLAVAEDGELHGLLDETVLPLGEGGLSTSLVVNLLDRNPVATHCWFVVIVVGGGLLVVVQKITKKYYKKQKKKKKKKRKLKLKRFVQWKGQHQNVGVG